MKAQTSQELAEQLIQAWTPSGFRTTKAVALIDAYVLEREAAVTALIVKWRKDLPTGQFAMWGRTESDCIYSVCADALEAALATARASQPSPSKRLGEA